jgi:hypothetical protein
MEILWTETALKTYLVVIDYLFEHWSLKEITSFENKVETLLDKILIHNELCPISKSYNFRKCIIDSNNSMVYFVNKNQIIIVTFIDNRSINSY